MADLERLALKRDPKFLLRLILLLALGLTCGILLLFGLTGEKVSGCAANAPPGPTRSAP